MIFDRQLPLSTGSNIIYYVRKIALVSRLTVSKGELCTIGGKQATGTFWRESTPARRVDANEDKYVSESPYTVSQRDAV